MLKRELKFNFKSFCIWTSILLVLFLVVFLIYPSMIESENMKMLNEMMEVFPKDLLKAFNMDISSIDSAFGFLKTEGFVFVLLITGMYASILGSNILLKEENDKTIEYLNALPIKRKNILLKKLICGFIYILSMIIVIGIFNYIGLELSGDFNKKQYILLSITPFLSALPLFSISLFISTFTHKTKKIFGISLGIPLISYFLQVISELNKTTEFFKYFSVYTLSDIRNVITTILINPIMVIISLLVTLIFIIFSFVRYENKELL